MKHVRLIVLILQVLKVKCIEKMSKIEMFLSEKEGLNDQ